MYNVKIEFFPHNWYSSNPTTIVYATKCICVQYFQAIAKSSKKCDLHEISSALPKAYRRRQTT